MIPGDYHAFTNLKGVGPAPSKDLHGGKGAALLQMADAGLNVPPAAVFTTKAWAKYRETGTVPDEVIYGVQQMLEQNPGAMFSVRSGAPISMPGMMDTILNVGVDPADETYPGSFRRFADGWLSIVKGVPKPRIKELMALVDQRCTWVHGGETLTNPDRANKLIAGVIQHAEGIAVPTDPAQQILDCVKAVFDSWDTPRARAYRKMHSIPEDMGTGCIVQRMVMGTAPGFSGSGVMFSRNPATGENTMTGEIALNAQGEEVVSGEVTPENIWSLPPERIAELEALCLKLEGTYDDVQDIEFTYENGELFVLQTRTAKMSARARIITACAIGSTFETFDVRLAYIAARVNRGLVNATMVPTVQTNEQPDYTGLAASPGAITGKVVFRSTPLNKIDKNCILVCEDTSPDDFPKMAASGAIFTQTGGFTCHSAVVARGINVPAVVGCEALKPSDLKEGDVLTLDGTSGKVWEGSYKVKKGQPPRELYETLTTIADGLYGSLPQDVYYLESAIGQHVALTLTAGDLERAEAQIARAHRLVQKGKAVGFIFSAPGMGEDLITTDPVAEFDTLLPLAGGLKGFTILGGLSSAAHKALAAKFGMTVSDKVAKTVDLLDLLETDG